MVHIAAGSSLSLGFEWVVEVGASSAVVFLPSSGGVCTSSWFARDLLASVVLLVLVLPLLGWEALAVFFFCGLGSRSLAGDFGWFALA